MTTLNQDIPLCVDLDGTLVATDTLWESIFVLLRLNPLYCFLLPFWILKGKAYFKHQIAQRVTLNAALLPYRAEILDFINQQKQQGRSIILATAAHESIAKAVAQHLDIFDDVLANNEQINLKGVNKRNELEKRFGYQGFDYIGDAKADIPIFQASRTPYIVTASKSLLKKLNFPAPEQIFAVKPVCTRTWLKVLRAHQWVKNLLIFVPLIVSHQFFVMDKLVASILAFFAFSLVASAGYIFNDLMDLEADRQHPTKCNRPFAAGKIPIQRSLVFFVALLILSSLISFLWLPSGFFGMVMLYLLMTLTYSFYLKRKMILDVIILAGLFTHRILSGGIAASIYISDWLLLFSVFMFTSLAFLKRYIELLRLKDSNDRTGVKNRDYYVLDIDLVAQFGTTSAYLSVLVFAMYIYSGASIQYESPFILWMICPALLYWTTRVWFLANRRSLQDDPVLFALKDRVTWATIFFILAMMLLAKFV
ncbi:UbiA family prenyltransferase [Candidatus Albibeggiatoa sp. nov. NOAA]|uniref:UbiA family prenyltransferase n=1 Tax=Candidatus Albibeggiatoa sp. nov. NOAA TaxID=3162724 RepID=UPI0032F1B3FE|nr:UbiA family prenyltransferase [Thiotrichaceae bacterium]